MALRCAATRYASLLFSKTVHAAPRSGGSRYLLPERQMSRLASPTYLSACATLPQQAFDYFLLLDFEATCSAEKGVPTPQEIIEFPVLKVNGRTFETEATFHTYVQPQAHPQLTAFCIEDSVQVLTRHARSFCTARRWPRGFLNKLVSFRLHKPQLLTGIVQDMVDGQPHLQQVLSQFDVWMREQGLLQARTVFVTFGDWDLQKMLPSQCAYLGIPVPPYMTQWINLKKAFSDCTGHWPKTQLDALHFCGLPHLGRHHSGIAFCLFRSNRTCISVCFRSISSL
ncbi:snipper isoform X2 [Dermacentor variabilis]|uniref:snipper isoform X2 n=1 Tax=Dermacentor variabilis TaxID=34621 RepID=UPI003F5C0634